MSKDRNHRVTSLFIGILICVPVLALYHFGLFTEPARWLEGRLPRLIVLPEGGLQRSLLLQYGYYTLLAFSAAWVGTVLPALWQKFLFLLGVTYLTGTLVVTLAWSGIAFEPFSGLLAAWSAGLLAMLIADAGRGAGETGPAAAAEPAPLGAKTAEAPARTAAQS